MKKLFWICLCGATVARWAGPARAESPDNQRPISSVREYRDVDGTLATFDVLTLLSERYHILGAYADGTFRPAYALRRGELAGWLDRSAHWVESTVESRLGEMALGPTHALRRKYLPDGHENDAWPCLQALPEGSRQEPSFADCADLAQRYHVKMVTAKGVLAGEAPIRRGEFSHYLYRLFQYQDGPSGSRMLSRSDAARYLAAAIEHYMGRFYLDARRVSY